MRPRRLHRGLVEDLAQSSARASVARGWTRCWAGSQPVSCRTGGQRHVRGLKWSVVSSSLRLYCHRRSITRNHGGREGSPRWKAPPEASESTPWRRGTSTRQCSAVPTSAALSQGKDVLARIAAGRVAKVSEIAGVVAFPRIVRASDITGQDHRRRWRLPRRSRVGLKEHAWDHPSCSLDGCNAPSRH